MKLNRLLEITTILLSKKNTTATELAKRFSVSTRTIYRDIETLSSSGVPIYCTQGANGGISIIEEYTIGRTTLSDNEKDSILVALKTLKATKYPEVDNVIEKLGSVFKQNNTDWISIDFSPWGSNPNSQHKFSNIQTAILKRNVIKIDYINANNIKSSRKIEPLKLIFKSQAWYLWGYCKDKEDYRTFRISRIKNVKILEETFDKNIIHKKPENKIPQTYPALVHLVLEFTKDVVYRLYDDFDEDMLIFKEDGTIRLEVDFPQDEWVYGYILSYGNFVKVIEPFHIREIIKEKAKKILDFY